MVADISFISLELIALCIAKHMHTFGGILAITAALAAPKPHALLSMLA